jgi:hypothetical protein
MAENVNMPGNMNGAEPNPEAAVVDPERDVILGRGGFVNRHPGNKWYRVLVDSKRQEYLRSPKKTKSLVVGTK